MRVLGRKAKSAMLQAAAAARVVIAIYGDVTRCQFEPRVLADAAELESAISRWDFVALVTFAGLPPRVLLACEMDGKARRAFDSSVERLTATAASDGNFWAPQPRRLAMVSGTRTIEAL